MNPLASIPILNAAYQAFGIILKNRFQSLFLNPNLTWERSMKIFTPIICSLLTFIPNSFAAEYPVDQLPGHIRLLLDVGERPDISLDGKKFIYVTEPGGDVIERNIETGEEILLTRHPRPAGHGYWRALYMADGNYLLTCGDHRHRAYMQVLDKSLSRPPTDMGELVREGPTVSRTQNKVSWTRRQKEIWVADIVYNGETPELANAVEIMNSESLPNEPEGLTNYNGDIEPQNFRPPTDHELIFSRYGTSSTGKYSSETWLYNFETGEISNLSNRHEWYDEPEGVFPDGVYTLVECDMFLPVSQHAQVLDLYRMRIDGVGNDMVRLTHFGETELSPGINFKANQGVISDDGKFMLFGEGRSNTNDRPGSGFGIYHFDFSRFADFDVDVPEKAPYLSFTPSVIAREMIKGEASMLQPVVVSIRNKGDGDLVDVSIKSDNDWIAVALDDNSGNQQQITLSFTDNLNTFDIGQYRGTVSISANGVDTRKVAVILRVSDK
jgi:hypothetical protein